MNLFANGRNSELLIAAFGKFLERMQSGREPALGEIQQALKGQLQNLID